MTVNVPENPNCAASGEIVFDDLDAARPIVAIMAAPVREDEICDVVGVGPGGRWTVAFACKVADSGEGTAWLISGGEWGIRLRRRALAHEPWDLKNPRQWGESHKLYGSVSDIVFE